LTGVTVLVAFYSCFTGNLQKRLLLYVGDTFCSDLLLTFCSPFVEGNGARRTP
jgi:hypothetical protein